MEKELEEIEIWRTLRVTLNNVYEYNNDWKKAITLFETRLERKFFKPIQTLIASQRFEGEGFTIVTVQCALIEALASFRTGQIFNYSKNRTSPKYEYNASKQIFVDFLHSSSIFKDHFYKIDDLGKLLKDVPFNATDFYDNVRCALMHEARTKGSWKINATKTDPEEAKIFIQTEGSKTKLFRSILHFRLKSYIKEYSSDLGKQDIHGARLRRYFARKLDHLFDIPSDPTLYEWWKDF